MKLSNGIYLALPHKYVNCIGKYWYTIGSTKLVESLLFKYGPTGVTWQEAPLHRDGLSWHRAEACMVFIHSCLFVLPWRTEGQIKFTELTVPKVPLLFYQQQVPFLLAVKAPPGL